MTIIFLYSFLFFLRVLIALAISNTKPELPENKGARAFVPSCLCILDLLPSIIITTKIRTVNPTSAMTSSRVVWKGHTAFQYSNYKILQLIWQQKSEAVITSYIILYVLRVRADSSANNSGSNKICRI